MKRVVLAAFATATLVATPATAFDHPTQPVTVADSIALTEIGEPWDDLLGRNVAHPSPDGRSFAVVTREGNIATDSIDYSLHLFGMRRSGKFSSPRLLTTVSSRSNSPGISDLKWLDNDTLLFRAASSTRPVQLNSISISAGIVREQIVAPTSVAGYGVGSGGTVVLLVQPQPTEFWNEKTLRDGLVISNELLSDLFTGHSWSADEFGTISPYRVLVQNNERKPNQIATANYKPVLWSPVVAPDGLHGVIQAWVDKASVKEKWELYTRRMARGVSPVVFLLTDHQAMASRLLLDVPVAEYLRPIVVWTSNSTVVIANTYLPLAMVGAANAELQYAVEINILDFSVHIISQGIYQLSAWDADSKTLTLEYVDNFDSVGELLAAKTGATVAFRKVGDTWMKARLSERPSEARPRISIQQGINLPPSLVAESANGRRTTLIAPKNLDRVQLSPVQEVTWLGDGSNEVIGGLYLPVGHQKGKSYPLVIQTHGWFGNRFSLDGPSSAGYAARALAGKGFAVLQVPDIERWDGTPEEGPRNMAMYESAVDYLRERGLIDTNRIGILGWSRTGYHVRYALAFSRVSFGAAVVADGMDGSYGQYLSELNIGQEGAEVYEAINGGVPFGHGLKAWTERASGFNLHRVTTPTRLLTFTTPALFCNWEWFVGLRRLGTPVEHVWIRDAAHAPIRPSHRLVAQQGTVDWFDFWLNGRERADADPEQYRRWRVLRETANRSRDSSSPALSASPL